MASEERKRNASSPYSMKMGNLKGHVSVKSNAFSPTCKRLSSQDMVLDNMVAHAKKVNTAKSRIDNSLPKSWTTSIVKRDQMRRQAIARGATPSKSRPSSASKHRPSSAPVTAAQMDQYLNGSLCSEDMEILSDIYGDDRISQYNTPRTLRSTGHRRPQSEMNGRTSQVIQSTIRNPSHDLLDTRASKFTEGGHSHTPRTLKTTATSRLAQSKYYNPPKRKGKSQTPRREDDGDEELHQRNGDTLNESQDRRTTGHDRHKNAESKRNEDHIRWMEEQAERVNHLRLDDTAQDIKEETMNSTMNDLPIYSARLETMSYRSKSQNEKRMREEEEELKYLEFVTDVTNDVLNRGIFSNTVLKQVFDAHIERNKDKLNEERMRHLMKQLKEDLAIPDET